MFAFIGNFYRLAQLILILLKDVMHSKRLNVRHKNAEKSYQQETPTLLKRHK